MNYLKIFGGLASALAVLAIGFLVKDRFHQKALADAAAACNVAAASLSDNAPLDSCLDYVTREIREARQARICESTLLPQLRPETRFAMSQSCGAGVKRLVADGDAAAADRDGLVAQLAAARADSAAAVTRAEARSTRQHQRTEDGQKVIQAAPRDTAGGIRCDAECLRRLAGR